MTTAKPDFDNLPPEELLELDLSKTCEAEMHPHLMRLVTEERERQAKFEFHPDGSVHALDGVTQVPEFFQIEMGNGTTKPMSSFFIEEYRAILKVIYKAPSAEELKASSYEEMALIDLIKQRPRSLHYNDFMAKMRELMGQDMSRVDAFLEAKGSYDQLVMLKVGANAYSPYTHEFVDELRALLIHYRDLPKAGTPK